MVSSSKPAKPRSLSSADLPHQQVDPSIQKIDELFQTAGLVRNLRGKAPGTVRRARTTREAPEELTPALPIPVVAANGVPLLKIAAWQKGGQKIPWLWHGFSTRQGGFSRAYCAEDAPGELNLGFTAADDREDVTRNRQLLVEAVTGDPAMPLITLRQIHSSVVVIAAPANGSRQSPPAVLVPGDRSSPACKADGLITDQPGLLLGVQTADCIPVLVADRRRKVVAAFHAGWRGTVKRIVEAGIGRMRLEFGCLPEDLTAAIGPGVGACCYAVGEEVLSSFESQFAYFSELFREVDDADEVRRKYPMLFLTQRAPGHSDIGPSLHLDLVEANRRQLLSAGLKPGSIHATGGCTSCHRELFFSHRASQGHAGRMMSVIGIRDKS